jgi:DNA replication licensing factor MCM7
LTIQINYEEELVKINDFLSKFIPQPRARKIPSDDDDDVEDDLAERADELNLDREPKYMRVLRRVANRQTTEIIIDLNDLKQVG